MSLKKKIPGERLETGQYNENTSEHLHRYALAAVICENRKILDIACGEGYGSNLLSKKARSVSGVDIDAETVAKAKEKYRSPNLEYKTGSADKIPYADHSFEIVISFETLEHHDRHREMMQEIKRVLIPGGLCIISTPDKLIYSDKKNYKNPFHVKELYKEEFRELLKGYFKNVNLFKQQFFSGSLIVPEDTAESRLATFKGDFNHVESNSDVEAEYLIAFASDDDLIPNSPSIFIDTDFTQNKILQFQRSSLRYKLGNLLLAPIKFLRGKK